ncbi:hypothetical protein R3P38DRAFT_3342182 [Favolaschia claudopus]|uniref:Transposase n=1 Tax=Favolaschia claudopus TaxID=2862362 RepID=A0AAW0E2P6_9AGAR
MLVPRREFNVKFNYLFGRIQVQPPASKRPNPSHRAPSTSSIMGENVLAMPSRIKADIIVEEKKKKHPAGVGLAGAYQLYLNNKGKEASDPTKYYHRWQEFPDNGVAIFACYTSMLALLDDAGVESFEDDTTFKRLRDLNEWKLVIFYKVLQRALILARVYTNRETTDVFEWIFDTLRELKRQDGNLLVMVVDMEAAQILGASRSLLKTNQPKYSGIHTEDPAEFATYFVKLCSVHVLRGINDFRGMVSEADFRRLQNVQHLESHDAVVEFTQFVAALGIKKISDWWGHKLTSKYIAKCMIKSQSNIFPHHWDRTARNTNIGEGMHAWTNRATGINLALVDGMEGARKLDYKTVRELEISTNSGVLLNTNNTQYHRLVRNNSRASTAARKIREAHEQEDQVTELQAKLDASRAMRKESMAMEKELQAELKAAKGNKTTQRKSTKSVVVSSSSSGRVKTTQVHADAGDKSSEPDVVNNEVATSSTAPGELIIDFTTSTGTTMDISLSPNAIPDPSLPANTPEFDEFLSKICMFNFLFPSAPQHALDAFPLYPTFNYDTSFAFSGNDSLMTDFEYAPAGGDGAADVLAPFANMHHPVDHTSLFTAQREAAPSSAFSDDWFSSYSLPAPRELSPADPVSAEPPVTANSAQGKPRSRRQEVDESNNLATRRIRIKRTRSTDNAIGANKPKKVRGDGQPEGVDE